MEKRILFNLSTLMLLCFFFNTGMAAHFNPGPVNHVDSNTDETFVGTVTVDNLVNESCAGNNDGSVDLTIGNLGSAISVIVFIQGNSTGSSQTVTWTVASGSATGTFSNLEPDTYALQLLASNNTTGASPPPTFTIAPGGALIALVESLPTCNGNSDGSIMVNATGGVAPYEYSLDNARFQTVNVFGNLAAGSYSFRVRDASGCITSETFQLTEPDPVAIDILTLTPPTCNGGSNGWIALQAAGGDGNYEYSFDGGTTFSTAASLTNLPAGNYSIVVRDGNGCTIAQTPTLTEPAAVTSSLIGSTNVTCLNQSDGTVTLDASGGTGTYSVWFQNSIGGGFLRSFTPNSPITGIEPGTYDLEVRDSNGCLDPNTFSVTITEPAELEASSTINTGVTSSGSTLLTIICSGTTADITVSATGGTTPYEYSIDGGSTFSANPTFTALSDGQYSIVVRDANGCTDSQALDRTILTSSPVAFSANLTDVSCFGGNDGAITVFSVSGGASVNRTYSLDGTNFQNSPTFTNLTAGNYTVTVLDQGGCIGSNTYTINEPAAVTVSANITDVSCFGEGDGSAELVLTGASTPIAYTLDGNPSQASNTFTNLAPGNYTATATYGPNNCTISATFTITEPTPISVTSSTTDVTCNGDSNGSFTVSATGGQAPYTYSIDGTNFGASDTFSNLTAGSYTLTIKDANDCTETISASINEPTAITVSHIGRAPDCIGDVNGQIQINLANGGTGLLQIRLQGTTNLSSSIQNLAPGDYTVETVDTNGCFITSTVTVPEAAALTADVTVDANASGCGNTDGAFTMSNPKKGSQTIPQVEYSIDGQNYQSSPSFTGLASGVYTVDIRDITPSNQGTGNCEGTVSVTITEPSAITASLSTTDILCNGTSTGSIDVVNTTGGTSPYEYSIDGTNFQTSDSFTNLAAGSYAVTVKDAGNCTFILNTTLTEADLIQPAVTVTDAQCHGDAGSLSVSASGGTGPYEYSLDGTNFGTGTFVGLLAGNYTVTVRDASLCTVTTTATVGEPTAITGTTSVTDVTCNGGSDGAFTVSTTGGLAPYTYSIDGGTNFGTSDTFSGLSAGNYNIIIKDANDCTEAISVSINEPTAITASHIGQAPGCIGDVNGQIQINLANGGTGLLQIRLQGTTNLSSSIQNLAPGDYTVETVDTNGCFITSTVTVPEAAALTADVTVDANASGCGNADGAFTMSNPKKGSQTIPQVEYSIDGQNYQSSPSFTGLASGVYTVDIRDITPANQGTGNCAGTVSVTITEPSNITASLSTTDLNCNSDMSGALTVSGVSGGVAPYTYSIDGVNFVSTTAFNSLAAGNYDITIRDNGGCTTVLSTTISEPDALSATFNVTDISCNGANDGTISLTVTGGTAPYTFTDDLTLSAAAQAISGNTATFNAEAGVRSNLARITDANGCTFVVDFTINEPDALAASITNVSDVTCNGGSDGTITIVATGGTAPYEASSDGTQYFPLASDGVVTGIGAVTIANVTVRDANGCDITIAGFTVNEPAPISATITPTPTSCNGSADGVITVVVNSTGSNATGGSAVNIPSVVSSPYEYSIDGVNFFNTGFFGQLAAGSYTVTVKETATDCTNTFTATVTEPDILEIDPSAVDVTCKGQEDGQIIGAASGGTAPYEYSIDGGTTFQTEDFTGLDIGTYDVTVRDASGCTTSKPVTIAEPTELELNITSTTDASCNGLSDGAATETVNGGTAPYTYSLDAQNFNSTIDLTALSAGSYTLTVKDGNDCTVATNFTINEPSAIVPIVSTSADISCNGLTDGSFTVTATGGDGTFMYSIDGTNFSATNTFTNLSADTYTVTVQDGSGCTATMMQTIIEPAALNPQFESVDITCNGETDGQITGIATGGTAPYTYSIDGTTFQSTAFSGLAAGSYTLTVKDANDCEATTTVDISEPAVLAASISSTSDVDCNSNSTGSAVLAVTGGSTPYSYSLDGSTFDTSIDLTALSAGAYSVTIRDANSCETTTSFTITEPDVLGVSLGMVNDASCNGATDGSISVAGAGGTAPYQYAIDGTTFGTADTFSNLAAGSYTVTLQDANGCTATVAATVTEPAAVTLTFTTVDLSCNGDSSGEIAPTATGGTAPYEYSLDGTNFQSGAFSGQSAGTYTLTVRDGNGCTETASVTLTEPIALSGTTVVTDILCFGDSDGSITVTAAGGTAPYEYSTDGSTFQSGDSFSALAAGSYTVTVRDANSCTITVAATVAEPAELTVSATVINDNTISVTASGGTAPYEYALDNGTFQTASTFNGLANGDYSITVRDANGCTVSTTGSLVITSTDDPFTPVSISAYPNPVSDYLTFSRLAAGDQIRLVSLNGNSLDLTLITEEKTEYRKDISGIRQKVFLAIVVSKDGKIKLNQKVMKRE